MLRRRVRWTVAGIVVAMALLLRLLLGLQDAWVEDAALRDLLEHEMTFLVASEAMPRTGAPRSSALHYYRPARGGAPPPPEVAHLRPGLREEVRIGEELWRVLVRDVAPGDRAWLLYQITFVEQREEVLAFAATASFLVLLFGAWAFGRFATDRALAPLDELVSQIRRLDPDRRGQRVAVPAPDSELQVIADAINRHLEVLEAMVERERSFAAAASHELRTPLAVIQGSAEMLAAQPRDPARPLARMRRAVQEAREQLEALLALSRTRESPPLEELRLHEWLPGAGESLVGEFPDARVTWACVPTTLVAPPGAVRIVFGNLLRNALRVAPRGEIRITVEPGRVAVEDDGPGVADEIRPRVFEPGFRGREGGTGMGLYIAKAIADRYGWHLALGNRPEGRGACAEWRFPEPVLSE